MAKGDLVFNIKQKSHARFKRVGNNLFMDLQITLKESLLGFERTITHLDSHQFKVNNEKDEIIQPDQWLIVKGKGMPIKNIPSSFGDLHIKMKVKFPTSVTNDQINQLNAIFLE